VSTAFALTFPGRVAGGTDYLPVCMGQRRPNATTQGAAKPAPYSSVVANAIVGRPILAWPSVRKISGAGGSSALTIWGDVRAWHEPAKQLRPGHFYNGGVAP
jgi:hypothetical protein